MVERIRLDKLLSNTGYGTRSTVRKYIRGGRIKVNGKIIVDQATHVDTNSEIFFDEIKIEYKKHYYLMLNKPPGYVSATYDPKDPTVIDLLSERFQLLGLFPVGRLDKDTEGLIFLTNNGKLAHNMLAPSKHVYKTYYAEIKGLVTESDIQRFQEGVVLDDDYKTMPAILKILEGSEISKVEIQIKEGKFHQIKRMFVACGKEVLYLKRLKIGPLELDPNLKLSEFRELTESEIDELLEIQGKF